MLEQVRDFTSGAVGGALTGGGTARLRGSQLKVDMADPQQGLFLVATNGTATRIAALHDNLPAELLFTVPSGLAPGAYRPEVRTRYRSGSELKTAAMAVTL